LPIRDWVTIPEAREILGESDEAIMRYIREYGLTTTRQYCRDGYTVFLWRGELERLENVPRLEDVPEPVEHVKEEPAGIVPRHGSFEDLRSSIKAIDSKLSRQASRARWMITSVWLLTCALALACIGFWMMLSRSGRVRERIISELRTESAQEQTEASSIIQAMQLEQSQKIEDLQEQIGALEEAAKKRGVEVFRPSLSNGPMERVREPFKYQF
jgi:hypothetical protein